MMDFLFKSLLVCLMYSSLRLSAQPTACTEDSHCPTGLYCEEVAHVCYECIRCDELKRESSLPQDVCVKSIVQCGNCLIGLVEDVNRACVPADKTPDSGGSRTSVYVWSVAVPVIMILIGVAIYFFVKDSLISLLKITATRASVHSRRAPGANVEPQPPPYDSLYTPVRPASPPVSYNPTAPTLATSYEEESDQLIKRELQGATHGVREFANNQATNPFNEPTAYLNPPLPEYGLIDRGGVPARSVHPLEVHDEDTMESHWTPNEYPVENNNGRLGVAGASVAVVAGGSAETVEAADRRRPPPTSGDGPDDHQPPAKAVCVREDSNNNTSHGSGGGGGDDGGSVGNGRGGRDWGGGSVGGAVGSDGAPTFFINVQVANYDQTNNVNVLTQ